MRLWKSPKSAARSGETTRETLLYRSRKRLLPQPRFCGHILLGGGRLDRVPMDIVGDDNTVDVEVAF